MTAELTHDLREEIEELRSQLAHLNRIGFLFGAGISKALHIPDMAELTETVMGKLSEGKKAQAEAIRKELSEGAPPATTNIEQILNHVRLIRQITREKKDKTYDGISGEDARSLDIELCNWIYEVILAAEQKADLATAKLFVAWLNWVRGDFTKEVFTANYDLIMEKALEDLQVPYYDGFIGAHEPFFAPETIDPSQQAFAPPRSWIRLWKLHGSLGWFWKKIAATGGYRIVRLGLAAQRKAPLDEIVIYPSKEKYELSRKQPFLSYFDRLKSFILEGEGILLVSGYSFSDQHINEAIFDTLSQNPRMHLMIFAFDDTVLDRLEAQGQSAHLNLSAYGKTKGIIRGKLAPWHHPPDGAVEGLPYWDKASGSLGLGDFGQLVQFLVEMSGRSQALRETAGV